MATEANDTQRAELHKTIWRLANDLRGSVDGSGLLSFGLPTTLSFVRNIHD